ncbi:unnamed protein product, partial [marine sediment metagenome]
MLGAQNSSHAHFTTDRSSFYFSKEVQVNTGIIRSYDEDLNLNRAGSSTARLRVTSGTTYSDQLFSVENTTSTTSSGIVRLKSLTASSGPFIRVVDFIRSNNQLRGYIALNPYAVQYSTSSDYRLKRNVTPMENSIDRIKLLKPS